jgi:predicted MFS family arabinose efflux permease
MNVSIDSGRGRFALLVGFSAGMVDMVALPIWVGALIAHDGLDPQHAGALVTLFLSGVVLASMMLAPRFHRIGTRVTATCGFALSAAGFLLAARTADFGTLAALHALCGVATGAALSAVLGTIARSTRPHRLFAFANAAVGVFAVIFLGAVPSIVAIHGAVGLFAVFATVMAAAALSSALAFPAANPEAHHTAGPRAAARIPPVVWFGVVGIASLSLVQAMSFSFLQRAGVDHGFAHHAVAAVLVALGLVNLLPAPLAALLETRLPARAVVLAGPLVQALLVAVIMDARGFPAYAAASSLLTAVIIFTDTFAFGLLAQLEPSGRALAAMPAMMMTGSAIGPFLGGTLVQSFGYGSIALVAGLVAAIAVFSFSRLPSQAGAGLQQELAT